MAAALAATLVSAHAATTRGRGRGRKKASKKNAPKNAVAGLVQAHQILADQAAAESAEEERVLDAIDQHEDTAEMLSELLKHMCADPKKGRPPGSEADQRDRTEVANERARLLQSRAERAGLRLLDAHVRSPLCQFGALALAANRSLRPGTGEMLAATLQLLGHIHAWLAAREQRPLVEAHECQDQNGKALSADEWLEQLLAGNVMGDALTLLAYAKLHGVCVRVLLDGESDEFFDVQPDSGQILPPSVTVALSMRSAHYVAAVGTEPSEHHASTTSADCISYTGESASATFRRLSGLKQ